jgi:hypothetical protein
MLPVYKVPHKAQRLIYRFNPFTRYYEVLEILPGTNNRVKRVWEFVHEHEAQEYINYMAYMDWGHTQRQLEEESEAM